MTTTTDRLNGLTTSVAVKPPVKAVSSANMTLSGEQTINGVACVAGDRVLAKDQTATTDNGIWIVSTGAWTRATDFNGAGDVRCGTLVVSNTGTTIYYRVTTPDPVVVGTSDITFEAVSGSVTPASLGAVLYPRTDAEIAAGVTPTYYHYAPGNVLRYGADPTGAAESTAAFSAAWLAHKSLYAPAGTYLVDTLTPPAPLYERTLYGEGPGRTYLVQKTADNDVIALGSGGAAEHTIELRDFTIQGLGSGTGSGVRIPANGAAVPGNFKMSRIRILDMGGRGFFDEAPAFCSVIDNVQVDNCLDHAFDTVGGNTTLFIHCYAQRVPTAGKAGYRIHGGTPTLINCNGINAGDYWGLFGDLLAEDGEDRYCVPTLIGCNIEDFATVGLRNKRSGVHLINTTFVAPATGTVKALLVDGANNRGVLDHGNAFSTKGASWANSQPIHTASTAPPFSSVHAWSAATLEWYDDSTATEKQMSALYNTAILSGRFALAPWDLYVQSLLRNAFSGTATFAAATTVAVSFAAAQPDANYGVVLGPTANKTFWVTAKGVNGFTLNASSTSSDAVDWFVYRVG